MDATQLYDLTEEVVREINNAFPEDFDIVDTLNIIITHANVSRLKFFYKNGMIIAEIKITVNAPHLCKCTSDSLCVYEYKYVIERVFSNDYLACVMEFEIPVGQDEEYAYIYHIVHELSHLATDNFSYSKHIHVKQHGYYFTTYMYKYFKHLFDINFHGIKNSELYKMFRRG